MSALVIRVWNVQHGSAACVRFPSGHFLVHDLGAGYTEHPDIPFSPLAQLHAKHNIRQVDSMVITHPHRDHIDDILTVDQLRLRPTTLWRPRGVDVAGLIRNAQAQADRLKYEAYHVLDRSFTSDVPPEHDLRRAEVSGGVSFGVFRSRDTSDTNLNNHSLVSVLNYGNWTVVLPGDNEAASWEDLLGQPEFVQAISGSGILVAAHHGREAGWHERLFGHFIPQITVVSDGRGTDTSAVGKYSNVSMGKTVQMPGGRSETRKCVTTREDGDIEIVIDPSATSGQCVVRAHGRFAMQERP